MSVNFLLNLFAALQPYVPAILTAMALAVATATSLHVLLSRRSPGSSIAWIALVWLAPLFGAFSYLIFGINRIKRRAESIRPPHPIYRSNPIVDPVDEANLKEAIPSYCVSLERFFPLTNVVLTRPLLPGARLTPLHDGDETFPAMLAAIDGAEKSINLSTYIFDNDETGRKFVQALVAARDRGVEVRVLIDAAGLRYSFPSILGALRRSKINAVRFLPSIFPPHFMTLNLRNHRKLLIVDGKVGFTGGINIRQGHRILENPPHPARDLHFKVEGPVVAHIQEIFVDDWSFTTGEDLRGESYFPPLEPCGPSLSRGIPDGPDEDLDKLKWTILGAITASCRRIRILTPYFIPDESMVSALSLAAMRGVHVDLVLPSNNNLPFVQWASMAHLRPLLEWGVQITFSAPPFDHSKLMIIDDAWILVGSANLDPRSLRLNFEFNLESWDSELAAKLNEFIDQRIHSGTPYTLEEFDARSKISKVRDGIASLFSPYL